MDTGPVSDRIAAAVANQADVILYYINSVLHHEPRPEQPRTALQRTRAAKNPTGEEQ